MDWHKDEVLFAKPQYELVYTVSNSSDSITQWIDAGGTAPAPPRRGIAQCSHVAFTVLFSYLFRSLYISPPAAGNEREVSTEPNSLLLVRAESVLHRVLPVRHGERGILKIVFTSTSEVVPAFHSNLADTYL